jgi:hypothetical protein
VASSSAALIGKADRPPPRALALGGPAALIAFARPAGPQPSSEEMHVTRAQPTRSVAGTPTRRPGHRRTKSGLRLALALALAAAAALLASSALASSNVNFVGTWTPNTGVGWTIKHENRATGVCSGTTKLAGYHLVACRVSGHKYVFTITLGTAYKSHNSGTIKGNTLSGHFKDTNGTVEAYTATRH